MSKPTTRAMSEATKTAAAIASFTAWATGESRALTKSVRCSTTVFMSSRDQNCRHHDNENDGISGANLQQQHGDDDDRSRKDLNAEALLGAECVPQPTEGVAEAIAKALGGNNDHWCVDYARYFSVRASMLAAARSVACW